MIKKCLTIAGYNCSGGAGCTLSSAIAANLALGQPLAEAVRNAKDYVTAAIENSYTIGKGHSPVHHFYKLWD